MDKHDRLRQLAGIVLAECDMDAEAEEVTAIAVRHEDDEGAEDKEIGMLKNELGQIESELSGLFAKLNGFLEKVSSRVKEEQLENEPDHVRVYRNLQRAAWDAANGIEGTCRSLKAMLNPNGPALY